MLPDTARVSLLEQTHEEYRYYLDVWQTIDVLREGAVAIAKQPQAFLPQRPGEKDDIYRLRLEKISYTPVMATAIREFAAKLAKSPIHIDGIDADPDFWAEFRENTNGKHGDERELLNQLFSIPAYFKRVYVGVDRPNLGVKPKSAFEEKTLKNQPYSIVYEPLLVIDWDAEGRWYKTRQIDTVQEPLEEPRRIATWTLWTDSEIVRYKAEVREMGGIIQEIKVNGRWIGSGSDAALANIDTRFEHGLGYCPFHVLDLPDEMWTGNNVYLKQLQHLRIESSWTDAGTIAGTVQRIFTPSPPPPMDDERVVYQEPDYSTLKADNAHILVGSNFEFKESSGGAIAALTSQLETIERQIKDIVSMRFASSNTSVLQQSGASKEVDMSLLNDAMTAYGTKVAQLYQSVLRTVASMALKVGEVSVHGLDSYSTDNLDSMLEQSEKIMPITSSLPNTAVKLWVGKLVNLMAGSLSTEESEAIASELEALYASSGTAEPALTDQDTLPSS